MTGWGRLKKLSGHSGYSVDPKSGYIYWRGRIKGKPEKISTKEKQISKARTFVDDYRLKLTSDNYEKAKLKKRGVVNPQVSEIWTYCVDERKPRASKSTKLKHSSTWTIQLAPFWGDKNISDVNSKTITAYENWFLAEFPGRSFFQTRKYLQMFINYAHREGYISKKLKVSDLDKTIDGKLKKKKPFRIYTPDEQKRLLTNAASDRAKLLIMGYSVTGARKEELLKLEWERVHFDKREIELWSFKNREWRTVPMSKAFAGALEKWRESGASGESTYVFPMSEDPNRPVYSQLFDNEWVETKKAAGIKGRARVHDIRHTVATKTAVDGWPIPVACAFLDMTPKVYIETYCHVSPDDIAKHLNRSFK